MTGDPAGTGLVWSSTCCFEKVSGDITRVGHKESLHKRNVLKETKHVPTVIMTNIHCLSTLVTGMSATPAQRCSVKYANYPFSEYLEKENMFFPNRIRTLNVNMFCCGSKYKIHKAGTIAFVDEDISLL